VIQVLAPSEMDLDYSGDIKFVDLEAERRLSPASPKRRGMSI